MWEAKEKDNHSDWSWEKSVRDLSEKITKAKMARGVTKVLGP
jgi:hypothetical protein